MKLKKTSFLLLDAVWDNDLKNKIALIKILMPILGGSAGMRVAHCNFPI